MTYELLVKNVGEGWADFFKPFMCPDASGKCLFDEPAARIRDAYASKQIFPSQKNMFRAFRETPFEKVRIVLMGQDPYFSRDPETGQPTANGIAFSSDLPKIPPALRLIYDAIERDVYNGVDLLKSSRTPELRRGDAPTWMQQGVLCINSALTVEEKIADSHTDIWEGFMLYLVSNLWRVKPNIIFMGWGARAGNLMDWKSTSDKSPDGLGVATGVNIFKAFLQRHEHPSAAGREGRPWLCNHFSFANLIIRGNSFGEPIQW